MAVVSSSALPLGSELPSFRLSDVVTGTVFDSDGQRGRVTVLMVICNHCPFVKAIFPALAQAGADFVAAGVTVAAISANDPKTHPEDAPPAMADLARSLGFDFPYLFDQTQEVARALKAECTPEFFVFGTDGALVYRGQFDDSRPGNGRVPDGADLRAAVDAASSGRPVAEPQRQSVGCNIKWRSQ